MDSQAGKYKRGFLIIVSIILLFCMSSCSPKEQESGQDREDAGGTSEGSASQEAETETGKTVPVQYIYSSETVTFTEYGDRVDKGFCFINNEHMSLPAMTPEQLDMAMGFIEGVNHIAFDDVTVMNIIYEEAESYFQGQKDVGKVAEVIQNRVGLYLQEQIK